MWKFLALAIVFVGAYAAEDQNPQKAPQPQPGVPPYTQQQSGAPQVPPQAPLPKPGVKNATAAGRYVDRDDHEYGRGHGSRYGHGHSGHKIFRGYDVPLVDDYICDLDATILVVTNSDAPNNYAPANDAAYTAPAQEPSYGASPDNYGRSKRNAYGSGYGPPQNAYGPPPNAYGPQRDYPPQQEYYGGHDSYEGPDHHGRSRHQYGPHRDHGYDNGPHHHEYESGVSANADRLRCSVIASFDEDACTACCQLSARRDRSISKHKVIGFLVDNNQLNYDAQSGGSEGYGDNYASRKKRSDYSSAPPQAPVYGQDAAPIPPPESEGDFRCVCCAPKRYRPFIFDRFSRRHHYGGHGGPY